MTSRGSLLRQMPSQDSRQNAALECLQKLQIFQGCRQAFLLRLSECLTAKFVPASAVLGTEGDDEGELVLLRRGSAKASAKDGAVAETFMDGDLIGNPQCLVCRVPWAYTVTATDFCDVQVLAQKDYRAVANLHAAEAALVAKNLESFVMPISPSSMTGHSSPKRPLKLTLPVQAAVSEQTSPTSEAAGSAGSGSKQPVLAESFFDSDPSVSESLAAPKAARVYFSSSVEIDEIAIGRMTSQMGKFSSAAERRRTEASIASQAAALPPLQSGGAAAGGASARVRENRRRSLAVSVSKGACSGGGGGGGREVSPNSPGQSSEVDKTGGGSQAVHRAGAITRRQTAVGLSAATARGQRRSTILSSSKSSVAAALSRRASMATAGGALSARAPALPKAPPARKTPVAPAQESPPASLSPMGRVSTMPSPRQKEQLQQQLAAEDPSLKRKSFSAGVGDAGMVQTLSAQATARASMMAMASAVPRFADNGGEALQIWTYAMQEDDEASRRELACWLDKVPFVSQMDAFVFERLLPLFHKRAYKRGEHVVRENQTAETLHIVYAGYVDVCLGERRLTTLGPETILGERALANLTEREPPRCSATVTVASAVVVTIALKRADIKALVASDASLFQQLEVLYSSKVKGYDECRFSDMAMFCQIDPGFVFQLTVNANAKRLHRGELLVREGIQNANLYILTKGALQISRSGVPEDIVLGVAEREGKLLCLMNVLGIVDKAASTIFAASDECWVQVVSKEGIRKACDAFPEGSQVLREAVECLQSHETKLAALGRSRRQQLRRPSLGRRGGGGASAATLFRRRSTAVTKPLIWEGVDLGISEPAGLESSDSSSSGSGGEGPPSGEGTGSSSSSSDPGSDGSDVEAAKHLGRGETPETSKKQVRMMLSEDSVPSIPTLSGPGLPSLNENIASLGEDPWFGEGPPSPSSRGHAFSISSVGSKKSIFSAPSSPRKSSSNISWRGRKSSISRWSSKPTVQRNTTEPDDPDWTVCGFKKVAVGRHIKLVPEFSKASTSLLSKFESLLEPRIYINDQVVLRYGEDMDQLFILQRGTCKMAVFKTDLPPIEGPCIIGGMMSLLTPKVMTTVVAAGPVFVAAIDKHEVAIVLDQHPEDRKALFSHANTVFSELCDSFRDRFANGESVEARLTELPILDNCNPHFIKQLAKVMRPALLLPGQAIVQEDEAQLFVLFEGYCHIIVRDTVVSTVSSRMVFGEFDVFGLDTEAFAGGPTSFKPVEFCEVGTIGSKAFLSLIGRFPAERARFEQLVHTRMEASICAKVSALQIFEGMPGSLLPRLCQLLERRLYLSGSSILQQGDVGDSMVVVNHGKADVFYNSHLVGMLWSGKSFGQAQMLGIERIYHASVTAKVSCHILIMSTKSLNKLSLGNADRRWITSLKHRARATLEAESRLFRKNLRERRQLDDSFMIQLKLRLASGLMLGERIIPSLVFVAWRTHIREQRGKGPKPASHASGGGHHRPSPPLGGLARRARAADGGTDGGDGFSGTRSRLKGGAEASEAKRAALFGSEPPAMQFSRGFKKVFLDDDGGGVIAPDIWKAKCQSGRLDVWSGMAMPDWLLAVRDEIPKQLISVKREARGEAIGSFRSPVGP